jgi:hypothetical protein
LKLRPLAAFGLVAPMLAASMAFEACVDESHELQVQSLGDEASGVPRGPLHRPGQPCLVCHGVEGPASHQFVLAGTAYATEGETAPSVGALVTLEDVGGSLHAETTNEVGNFYVQVGDWSPTFPLQVTISQGENAQQMLTHIGRAGSCADCHTATAGPLSAGPVYVAVGSVSEGGP